MEWKPIESPCVTSQGLHSILHHIDCKHKSNHVHNERCRDPPDVCGSGSGSWVDPGMLGHEPVFDNLGLLSKGAYN